MSIYFDNLYYTHLDLLYKDNNPEYDILKSIGCNSPDTFKALLEVNEKLTTETLSIALTQSNHKFSQYIFNFPKHLGIPHEKLTTLIVSCADANLYSLRYLLSVPFKDDQWEHEWEIVNDDVEPSYELLLNEISNHMITNNIIVSRGMKKDVLKAAIKFKGTTSMELLKTIPQEYKKELLMLL